MSPPTRGSIEGEPNSGTDSFVRLPFLERRILRTIRFPVRIARMEGPREPAPRATFLVVGHRCTNPENQRSIPVPTQITAMKYREYRSHHFIRGLIGNRPAVLCPSRHGGVGSAVSGPGPPTSIPSTDGMRRTRSSRPGPASLRGTRGRASLRVGPSARRIRGPRPYASDSAPRRCRASSRSASAIARRYAAFGLASLRCSIFLAAMVTFFTNHGWQ